MTCVSIGISLLHPFSNNYKIYNCIDEYNSGEQVNSFFSSDNYYQHAHKGILQMILLVAGSRTHRQQWEQAHHTWAARGM